MPAEHEAGWTEARVAHLRRRWLDDGVSAAKIASELGGGITRNAVIGKINRLKLDRPALQNAINQRRGGRANKPAARQRLAIRPDAASPAEIAQRMKGVAVIAAPVVTEAKTLVDLGPGECKRPVGEATGADQLFCARPTGGGAYCDECQSSRPLTKPVPASTAKQHRSLIAWASSARGRSAWR